VFGVLRDMALHVMNENFKPTAIVLTENNGEKLDVRKTVDRCLLLPCQGGTELSDRERSKPH
jgi:hypothetical protein